MLSILAAIFISSPDPWTFFTHPDWLPDDVPSQRTPGSDEAQRTTHRLDSTALASVYACYDAFCERVYFLNEGNSNLWNEAEWGGLRPGADFLFCPTGVSATACAWHYDPDTNRCPRTRRFAEYDRLESLAESLGGEGTLTCIDEVLRLQRPLWGDSTSTNAPSSPRFLVSSSRFDEMTNLTVDIFTTVSPTSPDTEWRDPYDFMGNYSAAEWSRMAMHFGVRRPELSPEHSGGDVPRWDNAYLPNYGYLATHMLDATNFDEPPFTDRGWRVPDYVYYRWMPSGIMDRNGYVTLTTADIIGKGSNAVVTTVATTNWIALARDVDPPMTPELSLKKNIYSEAWDHYLIYWGEHKQVSGKVWVNGLLSRPGYEVDPGGYLVISSGVFTADVSISYSGEPFDYAEYQSTVSARLTREVQLNVSPPLTFFCLPVTNDFTLSGSWSPWGYEPPNELEAFYGVDAYNRFVTPRFDDPFLMVGVVSYKSITNYLHGLVGVEGIANDTRRLVTDRVAGVGRALAAIDRTYHRLDPVISTTGSNVHHRASMKLTASDVVLKIGWDGPSGILAEKVTVGPFAQIGEVERHTNYVNLVYQIPNHFEVRASGIENSAGVYLSPRAETSEGQSVATGVRVSKSDFITFLEDALAQFRGTAVSFTITFGKAAASWQGNDFFVNLPMSITVTPPWPGRTFQTELSAGPFSLPPGEFTAVVEGSYSRSYNVMHHLDMRPQFPDGHPVSPGHFAAILQRVRDGLLWSVSSAGLLTAADTNGTISVETPCLYPVSDSYDFSSLYRSAVRRPLFTDSQVRQAFNDEFDALVLKVTSLANAECRTEDVFDPAKTIPIDVEDLDSIEIPAGTSIHFDVKGLNTQHEFDEISQLSGTMDKDGTVTLNDFYHGFDPEIGLWGLYPMNWPLLLGTFVVRPELDLAPHVNLEPVRGVSAGGKIESWSQINWQWNALRIQKE